MSEPANPETPRRPGQLDAEAARWFARMRAPDAENARAEFERWLARGALHIAAYNRAGELWSLGKFLSDARAPAEPLGGLAPPAETWAAPDEASARAHPRWQRAALITAACAFILVITGWQLLAWPGRLSPRPPQDRSDPAPRSGALVGGASHYETIAGETRTLRLPDGSTVILRPLSRLNVHFDAERRLLQLDQGIARFDVAHEARAFMVVAGRGTVTAHGTLFEVALATRGRVMVRLLRGSIAVALPAGPHKAGQTAERWLQPGEAIEFAGAGPPSWPSAAVPPDGGGATEFEEARLADLVARANRSSGLQIRLAPGLAELRVSGRFATSDPQALADNLAATLDLMVERRNGQEILLAKP